MINAWIVHEKFLMIFFFLILKCIQVQLNLQFLTSVVLLIWKAEKEMNIRYVWFGLIFMVSSI